VKHVFVVDEDIDVYDDAQIDWALATRFQADRDLVVDSGFRAVPLDPSLDGKRVGAKAGFDLTKPFGKGNSMEYMVPTAPVFGPAGNARSWTSSPTDRARFSNSWKRAGRAMDAKSCARSHRSTTSIVSRGLTTAATRSSPHRNPKERIHMSHSHSAPGGSVELNAEGLPLGFLLPLEERRVTRLDVRDDGIAVITLDRPEKLNAFDERMIREMRAAIWQANFDDRIKVVVITGAGRAFCSGRDINGLDYENNLPTQQYRAYVRANHEMLDDLESLEKPVVAAINGIAAGGGTEIAIACDFRIVAESGSFLLPENQLGVLPASGACSRLIQMIGIGRLKEMVLAALPIAAQRAYDIGLATRVAPMRRSWTKSSRSARSCSSARRWRWAWRSTSSIRVRTSTPKPDASSSGSDNRSSSARR